MYRTPYLGSMIENLIETAKVEPGDALFDLACGPGRLTIPISGYFK
jgi:ubiquinone/menaquinone biosynthesis C-methylase UbiE